MLRAMISGAESMIRVMRSRALERREAQSNWWGVVQSSRGRGNMGSGGPVDMGRMLGISSDTRQGM